MRPMVMRWGSANVLTLHETAGFSETTGLGGTIQCIGVLHHWVAGDKMQT